MKDCLLIIMARYPRWGQVKTRLGAEIGKAAALQVYCQLIDHHRREFTATPYAVEWRYTPARSPFRRVVGRGIRIQPQPDGSLGDRMGQIFAESFESGYRRVVMIGTDAPMMERRVVRQAFQALRNAPAVFQPTEDGGYALIGLATLLNVFSGIDWSTSRVMNQTRDRLRRHQIQPVELPTTFDIDTAADWQRWEARQRRARHRSRQK